MEAASTSEKSVNFYQTTRRYNPGDSHLHTRRRENLKSYLTGEEHRLGVFENRGLWRIFGPLRDEVAGDWGKLHN
jgi:hypothetical protein